MQPGEVHPFISFFKSCSTPRPSSNKLPRLSCAVRIILFRRFLVPFGSFGIILWDTISALVSKTQHVLRSRVTRLSLSDIFAQFAQRS